MSNLAPDRPALQATGPAARSAYSGPLTAEQVAAAVAELPQAAGVDQTLIEAWIEVGHQRARTAAALTHKACVLWDT